MKMSEIDRETVKQYARIDTDADDGLIESVYMPMAKEYILSYTGMTEEEAAVYKRGRNAHVHTIPHSASRADYLKATALECLLGDLYLRGQRERINELFAVMME